jgi:hypothetical protein
MLKLTLFLSTLASLTTQAQLILRPPTGMPSKEERRMISSQCIQLVESDCYGQAGFVYNKQFSHFCIARKDEWLEVYGVHRRLEFRTIEDFQATGQPVVRDTRPLEQALQDQMLFAQPTLRPEIFLVRDLGTYSSYEDFKKRTRVCTQVEAFGPEKQVPGRLSVIAQRILAWNTAALLHSQLMLNKTESHLKKAKALSQEIQNHHGLERLFDVGSQLDLLNEALAGEYYVKIAGSDLSQVIGQGASYLVDSDNHSVKILIPVKEAAAPGPIRYLARKLPQELGGCETTSDGIECAVANLGTHKMNQLSSLFMAASKKGAEQQSLGKPVAHSDTSSLGKYQKCAGYAEARELENLRVELQQYRGGASNRDWRQIPAFHLRLTVGSGNDLLPNAFPTFGSERPYAYQAARQLLRHPSAGCTLNRIQLVCDFGITRSGPSRYKAIDATLDTVEKAALQSQAELAKSCSK